jgi:beta-lactamase superfamily II metal-dependent hydrolase
VDLVQGLKARGKVVMEPFAGMMIGGLTVCSPLREFYRALLMEFTDLECLTRYENDITARERAVAMEHIRAILQPEAVDDSVLGGERTEPENDSSVVLATQFNGEVLLFTGDAGVPALELVRREWPTVRNCRWMQIPHHGSRRNLTEDLIEWFRPQAAFVSASGTDGHPRRKVVNAFQRIGTAVFSTHYPNAANLWYSLGVVPPRMDYGPAVQLYN